MQTTRIIMSETGKATTALPFGDMYAVIVDPYNNAAIAAYEKTVDGVRMFEVIFTGGRARKWSEGALAWCAEITRKIVAREIEESEKAMLAEYERMHAAAYSR